MPTSEKEEVDDAFPYTFAGVGVDSEGMIRSIFALAGAIAALFGGERERRRR